MKSLTTFTQFWCRSVGFHYLSKRVGHGHVNVKPKNPITDTHWYKSTVRACQTVLTQTGPISSNAAYNMQLSKLYSAFHGQKAGWLQGLRTWVGSADQSRMGGPVQDGWTSPKWADQFRMGGPDGITGLSVTAQIGTVGLIDQNYSRPPCTIHENFAPYEILARKSNSSLHSSWSLYLKRDISPEYDNKEIICC